MTADQGTLTHLISINQSIIHSSRGLLVQPGPIQPSSAQPVREHPARLEATRTKGAGTETPTRNPKPSISAPFPPIPAVSENFDVPQFCFDRRQVQAFNLGCEAPDAGGPPGRKLPRPRSQVAGDRRRAASRVARVPRDLGMLDPTGLPVNLPPLHRH